MHGKDLFYFSSSFNELRGGQREKREMTLIEIEITIWRWM